MTTTYLAAAASQLDQAQRVLDAQVMVLPDGACRLCSTTQSCGYRDAALAVFARYRRVSQRRPGASHPELVGARQVGSFALAGVPPLSRRTGRRTSHSEASPIRTGGVAARSAQIALMQRRGRRRRRDVETVLT